MRRAVASAWVWVALASAPFAQEPGTAAQQLDLASQAYNGRRLAAAEAALISARDLTRTARAADSNKPIPTKLASPAADYPADALREGISGFVAVEFTVDKNGKVQDPKVVRSVPKLDRAALNAVRKWRYAPLVVDGARVEARLTAAVTFVFRDDYHTAGEIELARFFLSRGNLGEALAVIDHALGALADERSWFGDDPESGPYRFGAARRGAPLPEPPVKVVDVRPQYPRLAMENRVQGTVILEAVLDETGAVRAARVIPFSTRPRSMPCANGRSRRCGGMGSPFGSS
jgi:TonB family protein